MTATIVRVNALEVNRNLSDYVELLENVVNSGSSVNFIAPMDPEINRAFWQRVVREVEANARIVYAAIVEDRVVGCAHLVPAVSPNGRHRAEVQKVLVHNGFRRRGIAQSLMTALEDEARRIGRWLLVLDTEEGSGAVRLYESLNYISCGSVPEFALSADGTTYRANVYYYKRL